MPRPSKGDRVVTVARLARPVWAVVQHEAAARGISISAYIADVLAVHVGQPEHVRELDQEVLRLAM